MTIDGASWSTQQLAEFLAVVTSYPDEASALQGAVQWAAESLDAEIGAVIRDGRLMSSVGFPDGRAPERRLVRAVAANAASLQLPGMGISHALVARMGTDDDSHLLVARVGEAPFTFEESNLLRAMARSLALTLRMLRLLDEERRLRIDLQRKGRKNRGLVAQLRERQSLLERLSRIQRSISLRAPLEDVLDAIVSGAHELLGDEIAGLWLADGEDEQYMRLVSHHGLTAETIAEIQHVPVGMGVGGEAIRQKRLVVVDHYSSSEGRIRAFDTYDLRIAMAAPVSDYGRVVGSLTVASASRTKRHYSAVEQEMLLAFAEHASLALTDAKTVATMKHQAFHDSLSGLPNRALFLDRLDHALARCRREARSSLAVLFLDIDRFKTVNDSYGHLEGDQLLVAVAERLRTNKREVDTVARLGGDEFTILLEDVTDSSEARAIADRTVAALKAPFTVMGRDHQVEVSIGIAISKGAQEDARDVLRNADLAMYEAKATSQGEAIVFEPGMHADLVGRAILEADLRAALEQEELVLQYQPVVEASGGRLCGIEALVRWNHPVRGLVPPLEFIPVAEEMGLIVPIGQWVLRQAIRQTRRWRDAFPSREDLWVSVNLSARQLMRRELCTGIEATLAQEGLPAQNLVLEITESTLMNDTTLPIDTLRRLRGLGVRVAIDDFGTGYSSLGYLQRFPIDILKIDRSFVDAITTGTQGSAVAKAIVALGLALGLDTVAEGVERADQLIELRQLHCRLAQGYYFSKPVDAGEIERTFLADQPGGKRRSPKRTSNRSVTRLAVPSA